jgi:hypothetical protein
MDKLDHTSSNISSKERKILQTRGKKFFLKEPFACQGNWWWHIPSLLNKKLFPSEPGTYFLEALRDQDE